MKGIIVSFVNVLVVLYSAGIIKQRAIHSFSSLKDSSTSSTISIALINSLGS